MDMSFDNSPFRSSEHGLKFLYLYDDALDHTEIVALDNVRRPNVAMQALKVEGFKCVP